MLKPGSALDSVAFRSLVKRKWRVSLLFSSAILLAYFAFIVVLATAKTLLAVPATADLPMGFPVGVGLILFAWLLTGAYAIWANSFYDKNVQDIIDGRNS